MPDAAVRLARKYMKSPAVIDTAPKVTASTVEQHIYMTTEDHKFKLLLRHLKEMNPYMALVFCNTREEAHQIADRLAEATDLVVDELHGDMSQGQRNQVIRNFEKARIQVLVASDIAARGLDVEGVTHVFNYGIPAIWNTTSTASAARAAPARRAYPSPTPRRRTAFSCAGWNAPSRRRSPGTMKRARSSVSVRQSPSAAW